MPSPERGPPSTRTAGAGWSAMTTRTSGTPWRSSWAAGGSPELRRSRSSPSTSPRRVRPSPGDFCSHDSGPGPAGRAGPARGGTALRRPTPLALSTSDPSAFWSTSVPTHRLTEIPADALKEIEFVAGPVLDIEMLSTGYNSEIAARLHFTDGTVFVKGLRQDHPRVWTQQREADINPHTDGLAPALRWHIQKAGWNLLGFEDLDARHADYSPGSPDLELVLQ